MNEPSATVRLLAVDPGGTTGWAEYRGEGRFVSGEDPEPLAFLERSEEWLAEATYERSNGLGPPPSVVCERYTITGETAKKTQAPWSLEIIGALRYLCHRRQVPFSLQTPADAKGFCDNRRLRALGAWHVGGEGHANDALRHAVVALARRRDPWVTARLTELANGGDG